MIIYWLMLLVPVWAVLVPKRLKANQVSVVWAFVGALFAILIGLRDQVGGDWFNYLPMFLDIGARRWSDAISQSDPGYALLSWTIYRLGGSIYAVNLFCASVLMCGTVVFCRKQPHPWLALLAAVPYMLIVVGMGYTRQSVALGFALLGLSALGDGRIRAFLIWVGIGALFHKSAVLLMPIAALASSRHRMLTIGLVGATTVLTYFLLLEDSSEDLWANYVEADMQSQGGAIRVAMNAIPALMLLLFRGRLEPESRRLKLWMWMAVFSLLCVPLAGLASTAVDRVALYLIPVQLFVFSRLPRLAGTSRMRGALVFAILGYYVAVQFVWLNFAAHAGYWVPYRFMPVMA